MFNLGSLFSAAIKARLTSPPRPLRQVQAFGTFRAGRNEEKRAARAREKELRECQVGALHGGLIAWAPKRHQSRLTVRMLSDRRLRQRGVRS